MTMTMMLYDYYSDEMKVTYDEECNNYSLACFLFFGKIKNEAYCCLCRSIVVFINFTTMLLLQASLTSKYYKIR